MNRRYLTESEQLRLLSGPKGRADELAQRDYHWMSALVLTGMRITEFSRLTVGLAKQALYAGWLVSPKGHCKGGRAPNEYAVTLRLREHLTALVRLSEAQGCLPDGDAPLVWGREGAAMSVRGYQRRMDVWVKLAGLDPRVSPHWLRHSRAMNIMRRSRGNNPLKVCQVAMNHRSLASTGVYLQLSREELAQELQIVEGGRLAKGVARSLVEVRP